jgi:transcriptional regulator with XRE-family HTH domain
MEIGKLITIQRNRLGITLEELAQKLDISMSYLSRIENDKRNFPKNSIEKICDILEIDQSKLELQLIINEITKKYGKNKYFNAAIKKIVLKLVEQK